MMNDNIEVYDKFFFIRNVLKRNKIDINFMNWIAWFFAVCSEFKKLCIKMFRKRIKKSVFLFQIAPQMLFSYQYEIFSVSGFGPQQFIFQKIFHVETEIDSQICFMMSVACEEKVFRISCVIKINMLSVLINREKMQTNQRSDFNIIFMNMIRKLNFKFFNLNSIDFRDFTMRTANFKKIFFFIEFDLKSKLRIFDAK